VPCTVYEAAREMRPLGVGINLQPNAVRELYDLGITADDLDRIGLPAKEWALVGLNGNDIYTEPRGLLAGYNWPQYAVHRGRFHMLLHVAVLARLGPDALRLGSRVTAYRKTADGWRIAADRFYQQFAGPYATGFTHDAATLVRAPYHYTPDEAGRVLPERWAPEPRPAEEIDRAATLLLEASAASRV